MDPPHPHPQTPPSPRCRRSRCPRRRRRLRATSALTSVPTRLLRPPRGARCSTNRRPCLGPRTLTTTRATRRVLPRTRQVTALGTNREHGRRQDDECEPGTAAHTQPTGDRTGKAKLSEWRDLVAKSKRVCARGGARRRCSDRKCFTFRPLRGYRYLYDSPFDIITINAASIRRRGTSIVLMRWAGARRSGNGLYSIDDPIPRAITGDS